MQLAIVQKYINVEKGQKVLLNGTLKWAFNCAKRDIISGESLFFGRIVFCHPLLFEQIEHQREVFISCVPDIFNLNKGRERESNDQKPECTTMGAVMLIAS